MRRRRAHSCLTKQNKTNRYVLSTTLSLYNKQLVGKGHGLFGYGAFPGGEEWLCVCVGGGGRLGLLLFSARRRRAPLVLGQSAKAAPPPPPPPLKTPSSIHHQQQQNQQAPLLMSSLQFGFQALLAKATFGAGLVSRTRPEPMPWPEWARSGGGFCFVVGRRFLLLFFVCVCACATLSPTLPTQHDTKNKTTKHTKQ